MKYRANLLIAAALAGAATLAGAAPTASAQAQTAPVQQYVVFYGEFKPDSYSIREGTRTLEYLTHLAHHATGVVHYQSYAEIGRPNFFSLIEIWQSAADYTAFQNASNTQKALGNLKPYLIAPLDERDGTLVE